MATGFIACKTILFEAKLFDDGTPSGGTALDADYAVYLLNFEACQ